jgi:SagB-type dehydrogenase family enzyme
MSSKEEAVQIIRNLGENECEDLLFLLKRVHRAEREWEHDIALAYNEFVKMRQVHIQGGIPLMPPGVPIQEGTPAVPLPPIIKNYSDRTRIQLPDPLVLPQSLMEIILLRRSRRQYSESGMHLKELSTILFYSAGINGGIPAYGFSRIPLRMFPSSGGLQSTEIYLVINSVENLESGLYHYQPDGHCLELLGKAEFKSELKEICLGQPYVEQAAVVIIFTGFYERLRWKYGERSYRYVCMDAGFCGQNVYLTSTALDIGVCAIAGFFDDKVSRLLNLEDQYEMPLLIMTLGRPQVSLEKRKP